MISLPFKRTIFLGTTFPFQSDKIEGQIRELIEPNDHHNSHEQDSSSQSYSRKHTMRQSIFKQLF